jgi:two-component system sensor histidine kinase YesM
MRKFIDKIKHMRVVQKLTVGYVLLICIPFSVFGYLFYSQMNEDFLDRYRSGQSKFAEQAYKNLEIEMLGIESVYSLFQNNVKLTEYLAGLYEDDWEMIYNYRKEINPTFSFAYLSNPLIQSIQIYKDNKAVLALPPNIADISSLSLTPYWDAFHALPPNKGIWTYEQGKANRLPSLSYTHKLYNESYTKELGIVSITAHTKLISEFFEPIQTEMSASWNWIVSADYQQIYKEQVPGWGEAEREEIIGLSSVEGVRSFYVRDNQYLVHVVGIPKWDLILIDISKTGSLVKLRTLQIWTLIGGILILGLLSLIYFGVASSIATRIIRFTRHLKRVADLKLAAFPGKSGHDEVGFLISSYNAMIARMEEMGQTVHLTELLRKEAEIKMLQAQIKPHFLYNTLETMRMMALMKGQKDLADVAFTLGNLLRYSLSKKEDETTLLDELDNVRDYISLHKVRMGERLVFEETLSGDLSVIRCPRFILQPFIENCILHGIGQMRGKGLIRLEIEDTPDQVCIRIGNNGAAIAPERLAVIRKALTDSSPMEGLSSRGGIGLSNVHERIKAFFGPRTHISVTSEEHSGTIFTIYLDKEGMIT